MTDDAVDLRFLGQQVQKLQVDVRDLRTDLRDLRSKQLRLEGDVASLRTSMEVAFESFGDRFERLEGRMDRLETVVKNGFAANDARFEQMAQTAATNLQIVLAAVKK